MTSVILDLTFTVVDADITESSNDSPAMVSCVDDERLEFQDGDLFALSEVHVMAELNDGKPRTLKKC